jgi:PAS domain S-box-containing protein
MPDAAHRIAHVLTDLAGTFISVDDSYCEVLGRERAELIGRSAVRFTNPFEQPQHRAIIKRLQDTLRPLSVRKSYVRPDGTLVGVRNEASAVTDGLGPPRLIATVMQVAHARLAPPISGLLAEAREMVRDLRARRAAFGDGFVAPKWLVALHCYILEAEGRPTRIADICREAGLAGPVGALVAMEMVAEGDLDIERVDRALEKSAVRLAQPLFRSVERHLAGADRGWATEAG